MKHYRDFVFLLHPQRHLKFLISHPGKKFLGIRLLCFYFFRAATRKIGENVYFSRKIQDFTFFRQDIPLLSFLLLFHLKKGEKFLSGLDLWPILLCLRCRSGKPKSEGFSSFFYPSRSGIDVTSLSPNSCVGKGKGEVNKMALFLFPLPIRCPSFLSPFFPCQKSGGKSGVGTHGRKIDKLIVRLILKWYKNVVMRVVFSDIIKLKKIKICVGESHTRKSSNWCEID